MKRVKTLVALLLLVTLGVVLAAEPNTAQQPTAFKTQEPLGEPTMSDVARPVLAQAYAEAAFTYNFLNYKENMKRLSNNFTKAGWESFSKALLQSNTLDTIIAKKLAMSAEAIDAPVILTKGTLKTGERAWRIQVPLLVVIQGVDIKQETHRYTVTMIIKHTPAGDKVDSFIATSDK
jgi:intracellular multiplication protein IcmL